MNKKYILLIVIGVLLLISVIVMRFGYMPLGAIWGLNFSDCHTENEYLVCESEHSTDCLGLTYDLCFGKYFVAHQINLPSSVNIKKISQIIEIPDTGETSYLENPLWLDYRYICTQGYNINKGITTQVVYVNQQIYPIVCKDFRRELYENPLTGGLSYRFLNNNYVKLKIKTKLKVCNDYEIAVKDVSGDRIYCVKPECYEDSDCKEKNVYIGNEYCIDNDIYRDYLDYNCVDNKCVYVKIQKLVYSCPEHFVCVDKITDPLVSILLSSLSTENNYLQAECVYVPYCGDGNCDVEQGETYKNCPEDCPATIYDIISEYSFIISTIIMLVALTIIYIKFKK